MMTVGAVQYRIYSARQKKSPLGFSYIFYQTFGNFSSKFYTPIKRSNLR